MYLWLRDITLIIIPKVKVQMKKKEMTAVDQGLWQTQDTGFLFTTPSKVCGKSGRGKSGRGIMRFYYSISKIAYDEDLSGVIDYIFKYIMKHDDPYISVTEKLIF